MERLIEMGSEQLEQTYLLKVIFEDADLIFKNKNKQATYLLTSNDIYYSEVLKTILGMLKNNGEYYLRGNKKVFTFVIPKSWYIGCQFNIVNKFILLLKGIERLYISINETEEDRFEYRKIHQMSNAFLLSNELSFVKKLQEYFDKEERDLLKLEDND